MTCHQVQTNLSLFLYGDLDFATEDALEEHLAECPACQLALDREKAWHANLNAERADLPVRSARAVPARSPNPLLEREGQNQDRDPVLGACGCIFGRLDESLDGTSRRCFFVLVSRHRALSLE